MSASVGCVSFDGGAETRDTTYRVSDAHEVLF